MTMILLMTFVALLGAAGLTGIGNASEVIRRALQAWRDVAQSSTSRRDAAKSPAIGVVLLSFVEYYDAPEITVTPQPLAA